MARNILRCQGNQARQKFANWNGSHQNCESVMRLLPTPDDMLVRQPIPLELRILPSMWRSGVRDLQNDSDRSNIFVRSPLGRASPKCYKCPKKHNGPTIWFHSIKLKLFKLISIFTFFRNESFAKSNQNKARVEF